MIFISQLKKEIINLIGLENTKKIFENHLENYIDISELTQGNLEYAHDFFETIDYKNISNYICDNFSFMDIIKKYYDIELPLDIVLFNTKQDLILNRRFSFYIKKKIVDIFNLLDTPEQWIRFNKILDLIDEDQTFLDLYLNIKEIICCDKLYNKILYDKKNLLAANLIIKYNLHNLKPELKFENLLYLANILDISDFELKNIAQIWINNINSDKDCEDILPIFASIINCEKLTDDIANKKITVAQAIRIYREISKNIQNRNLSVKNINTAFSIILKLQENNSNKNKLKTAAKIISMIKNDQKFLETKPFICFLAIIEKLPEFMYKNKINLTKIMPLMLKIYLMNAAKLLERNFSFKCLNDILDLLKKFNKNQKNISHALILLNKLDTDQEFYYCKQFMLDIINNKKIFKKSSKNKTKLFFYIKKLYIKYFYVSYASKYILKVVNNKKFDFDKIIKLEKKLVKKDKKHKKEIIDEILKNSC